MNSLYPPGCSGTPFDEPQAVDLTAPLQAYGRQDGLCGKDADLDYGGQIKVKSCFWHEDGGVIAEVYVYASICEPCQNDNESDKAFKKRSDVYADLVCMWNTYPGEWAGDDWVFWLKSPAYFVKIEHEWVDDNPDEKNIEAATLAIYKAIFADQGVIDFQESMTVLSKMGELLP